MKKFTADFETSTWLENETYVWAWAVCEIGNEENLIIGNNIDSFIEFCKKEKNCVFYFHNLKFDSEFIIYWAFHHGFKFVKDKKEIEDNTFTTIISDMGQFYEVTLYFKKGNKTVHKVTFIDSLKIIPFSVKDTAKYFGLSISKLELDYDTPREIGHVITESEKEYIKNDVLIMAQALKMVFDDNLTKMTRASNALADFKTTVNKSKFKHLFPNLELEIDKDLRQAYKGGFTYLNPIYKDKTVKNVVNLDVNSLYPFVMQECSLPFGDGIYFEGEYKEDKIYNLYIQMVTCSFEIKKNKIPTIQIKHSRSFMANEYLESSNNERVTLILTNIDLELFKEHYNIYEEEYNCGWKFKSMKGMFTEYINKWIERKNEATISGNLGQRTLAKLMLNALYGKFATSLEVKSKMPYLGEDDIVHYTIGEKEIKDGLYLPVGIFITSYARDKTIRTSQAIKEYSIEKYGQDMYIYSDTDSIKTLLSAEELEKFCEIDDVKLGAWKNEGIATRGKFVRQKCYLEEFYKAIKYKGNIKNKNRNNKKYKIKSFNNFKIIKITCAGMPQNCYSQVKWDNFKEGLVVHGKLTFKHVVGGVKLVPTDFTIKEEKLLNNVEKPKK